MALLLSLQGWLTSVDAGRAQAWWPSLGYSFAIFSVWAALTWPVLEAVLVTQPVWASHRSPNVLLAWDAARGAGLDVTRAKQDAGRPEIDAVLRQDMADLQAAGVRGTPTFFVNGKPLLSFGVEQLNELVRAEVEATRGTVSR